MADEEGWTITHPEHVLAALCMGHTYHTVRSPSDVSGVDGLSRPGNA